jgi:hypothetical protein
LYQRNEFAAGALDVFVPPFAIEIGNEGRTVVVAVIDVPLYHNRELAAGADEVLVPPLAMVSGVESPSEIVPPFDRSPPPVSGDEARIVIDAL